jgi:predicted nucleic acid-binding protein
MIVVDSSVWIDYFNGRATPAVELLDRISGTPLLVGDLIMIEVLQGFRRKGDFRRAHAILSAFEFGAMLSRDVAVAAARNYRNLRERGLTPRSTIDTIIATFCIINGHELLHDDRDFDSFEKHLGLKVMAE